MKFFIFCYYFAVINVGKLKLNGTLLFSSDLILKAQMMMIYENLESCPWRKRGWGQKLELNVWLMQMQTYNSWMNLKEEDYCRNRRSADFKDVKMKYVIIHWSSLFIIFWENLCVLLVFLPHLIFHSFTFSRQLKIRRWRGKIRSV